MRWIHFQIPDEVYNDIDEEHRKIASRDPKNNLRITPTKAQFYMTLVILGLKYLNDNEVKNDTKIR